MTYACGQRKTSLVSLRPLLCCEKLSNCRRSTVSLTSWLKKTTALKSETEAYADFLAEEARLKEIAESTRKLTKRKLDYAPRLTYKRDNSYKGRNREALIPVDSQEDFREDLETKFPRPTSRQPERRVVLRRV